MGGGRRKEVSEGRRNIVYESVSHKPVLRWSRRISHKSLFELIEKPTIGLVNLAIKSNPLK